MIQDYFSLDKKGNDYLLLRIINKVDFEEDVVWARDFSLSDRTGISKPVEQLMSYLKSGLDSLSDWNGDMEGFHQFSISDLKIFSEPTISFPHSF